MGFQNYDQLAPTLRGAFNMDPLAGDKGDKGGEEQGKHSRVQVGGAQGAGTV